MVAILRPVERMDDDVIVWRSPVVHLLHSRRALVVVGDALATKGDGHLPYIPVSPFTTFYSLDRPKHEKEHRHGADENTTKEIYHLSDPAFR